MHRDLYHRVMSRPIELHWLGWRTDTLQLHQAGWEISAQQSAMDNTMQLALRNIRHGVSVRGISRTEQFNHMHDVGSYSRPPTMPTIDMQLAHNLIINMASTSISEHDFYPIDPRPTADTVDFRSLDLDEICHFKKLPRGKVQEVLLKKASMGEILALALERQEPKQAEYRAEMMKRRAEEQHRKNSEPYAELRLAS